MRKKKKKKKNFKKRNIGRSINVSTPSPCHKKFTKVLRIWPPLSEWTAVGWPFPQVEDAVSTSFSLDPPEAELPLLGCHPRTGSAGWKSWCGSAPAVSIRLRGGFGKRTKRWQVMKAVQLGWYGKFHESLKYHKGHFEQCSIYRYMDSWIFMDP